MQAAGQIALPLAQRLRVQLERDDSSDSDSDAPPTWFLEAEAKSCVDLAEPRGLFGLAFQISGIWNSDELTMLN